MFFKTTNTPFTLKFQIIFSLILYTSISQTLPNTQYSILPANTQLSEATVGIPYERLFGINPSSINTSEVGFSAISILPQGLRLQTNGVLTGVPVRIGNYSLTIQAQIPSVLIQIIANYSLSVKSLQILNSSIPKVKLGIPFSITLSLLGGILPLTWSYLNLPNWAVGNGSVISGQPTQFGSFSFAVVVNDSRGNTASQQYTLVSEPQQIAYLTVTPSQITVTAGVVYIQILTPSGGSPPYVLQFPNKPSWLYYEQNQIQILVPTIGTYYFVVQVTDSKGTSQFINVTVICVNEQAGLVDYINKTTTNVVDPRTGTKMTIFNTGLMDIGARINISPPRTNNQKPRPQSNASMYQIFSNNMSFIKNNSTNKADKPPCQIQPNTATSIGIIKSINYLQSKIILNDNRALLFQSCTKQTFRSSSNSFKVGDSVTFAGNPKNQKEWFLYSISNLS